MKKTLLLLTLFCITAFTIQCDNSDDTTSDCFPNSTIAANINLSLPAYFNLNNPNGWVYYNGNGGGTRGLILVNTGTSFRAYDRNAPHLCPADDTTLIVDGGTKIVNPSDGAEWILTTGEPLNDVTQGKSPRRYNIQQNGNTLIISN